MLSAFDCLKEIILHKLSQFQIASDQIKTTLFEYIRFRNKRSVLKNFKHKKYA